MVNCWLCLMFCMVLINVVLGLFGFVVNVWKCVVGSVGKLFCGLYLCKLLCSWLCVSVVIVKLVSVVDM